MFADFSNHSGSWRLFLSILSPDLVGELGLQMQRDDELVRERTLVADARVAVELLWNRQIGQVQLSARCVDVLEWEQRQDWALDIQIGDAASRRVDRHEESPAVDDPLDELQLGDRRLYWEDDEVAGGQLCKE